MRVLKGFVTVQTLTVNTPDVVSPIGEMSTWSMTYTKERGDYVDNTVPGYRLVSARNIDSVIGELPVDSSLVTQVLEVVKAFYTYSTTNSRPFGLSLLKATIVAQFHDRVYNLNFGELVDTGLVALPQWITWESLEHNNHGVKIWLSDTAFADQYDEYQTTIVPPLAVLDEFFSAPGHVKTMIESINLSTMMDQVQEAKGNNPETFIRTLTFNYVPPVLDAQPIPTNWNILIYGMKGDNVDAIKDALVEYVLSRSTRTRQQWEAIFPDLFKRTEFAIFPRWDLQSVPNLEIQSGLYGSMQNPVNVSAYCVRNATFYPSAFVQNNITVMPFPFNAIMLNIVNGYNNITGKTSLTTLFPDYIPVSSTSLDFLRMTKSTQDWVLLIHAMLIAAEKADGWSSVPRTMRKVERSGKLYLSALYQNINYLVAVKANAMT